MNANTHSKPHTHLQQRDVKGAAPQVRNQNRRLLQQVQAVRQRRRDGLPANLKAAISSGYTRCALRDSDGVRGQPVARCGGVNLVWGTAKEAGQMRIRIDACSPDQADLVQASELAGCDSGVPLRWVEVCRNLRNDIVIG
jgi:hypothetical protein